MVRMRKISRSCREPATSLTACVFSQSSVEILARFRFAVKPGTVNIEKTPPAAGNRDAQAGANAGSRRGKKRVEKPDRGAFRFANPVQRRRRDGSSEKICPSRM